MLNSTQLAAVSGTKPASCYVARIFINPIWVLLLSADLSCVHKSVPLAAPTPAADNSYLDLTPGGRLRVVVPLLTQSGLPPPTESVQQDGGTFIVSAANLAGYDISHYSIEPASHGRVWLRFTAAEVTREGKTVPTTQAPALPFALPLTAQHIRLIYLIRQSQSDHNMAIAASKNLNALNAFTKRLEGHPDVCRIDDEIFCSWVPLGVAVRPESQP